MAVLSQMSSETVIIKYFKLQLISIMPEYKYKLKKNLNASALKYSFIKIIYYNL